MMQMTDEIRQMMIEEDLGWLDKLEVHEVSGRFMLGDAGSELPINVSHIMEEEEFTRKWLVGFALGTSLGRNYFPLKEWFSFTYNGTRAVLVVKHNAETGKPEPTLLVPPLITTALTDNDREILRKASAIIYVNANDTMKKNNMNANMELAVALADKNIGLQAKPLSMADLIPKEYFEKFGIIPEVEQKIYYIRDDLRENEKTPSEDLEKARSILYRDHKGEAVSRAEYQFVHELSLGQFIIEDKIDKAPASVGQSNEAPDTPEDPLEC